MMRRRRHSLCLHTFLDEHLKAKGTSLAKEKKALQDKSNIILQVDTKFLKEINYGTCCRGLCSSKNPEVPLAMQGLLRDEFAKRFRPESVKEDIMMAFEVFPGSAARRHVVTISTSASWCPPLVDMGGTKLGKII